MRVLKRALVTDNGEAGEVFQPLVGKPVADAVEGALEVRTEERAVSALASCVGRPMVGRWRTTVDVEAAFARYAAARYGAAGCWWLVAVWAVLLLVGVKFAPAILERKRMTVLAAECRK